MFIVSFRPNGDFITERIWGGPGDEYCVNLAVDDFGQLHILGLFNDMTDLDPTGGVDEFTPGFDHSPFLTKFSMDDYFWTINLGDGGPFSVTDIELDNSGNIFISGSFSYIGRDFDPSDGVDHITGGGGADGFISKFDPDGIYQWTWTIGGTMNDWIRNIALDPAGNVCFVGQFEGSLLLDAGDESTRLSSNGEMDSFIGKITPNVEHIWST